VLIGLQRPVVRNRNRSFVREAWPREIWSDGACELAERLVEADPEEKTSDLCR